MRSSAVLNLNPEFSYYQRMEREVVSLPNLRMENKKVSNDFYIKTDSDLEIGRFRISELVDIIFNVDGFQFFYFCEKLNNFIICKDNADITSKINEDFTVGIISKENYIFVNHHEGLVTSFEARGSSNVANILNAIEENAGISLWTDSLNYQRRQ